MITIRKNIISRMDDHVAEAPYTWVDARDLDRDDIARLEEEFAIPSELLADVMDEDEQSHIEKDDDFIYLIVRLPASAEGIDGIDQHAIPLGIVIFPNMVITICQGDSVVLEDLAKHRFRKYPIQTIEGFVISIMNRATMVYIRLLKFLNRQKSLVEENLHLSIKNYELIQLLQIQKSLVYFTTALTSNDALLEKLPKLSYFKLATEDDQDFLDDVIMDNKQAIEMANIYSNILTGTMDAFASVISNNMNVIMKRLTIISISLMFPTFVTSFFGMNVDLPFQEGSLMWIWLLVGCGLSAMIGAWLLGDRRNRRLVQQASLGENFRRGNSLARTKKTKVRVKK
ncbi:magnesium transporter CorA family protein [Parasphaerochaeta coccoides]|uniref:Mg2 transporter protein CorA family protein n=1 Tax=Parasphaerochaeta coccoides (strain ATCC BAA-1237 / DSM 17374 / SPN1) TaxID=760011 RepID=F4GJH8_PARC1|nr:magnesium transporter CorA family protein [Parasphaerochaeta coccoides]AEC02243.1 Mg2 transporter protein CorA family protein [Parasphaerochaeta coccoides DSM 17374]